MGLIVSFCPRSSGIVWICSFCDSKIGERHTKICDQTGIRRIHLDRRSQTIKCSLLDPVLHPFGNREFREGRDGSAPAGSETLHFSNRSLGVNPEDCRSNFAAIFSRWLSPDLESGVSESPPGQKFREQIHKQLQPSQRGATESSAVSLFSDCSVRSQTRAVLSSEAVTTRWPSGLNCAELTAPHARIGSPIALPVAASQTRAVLSREAVTTRWPSGLNCAE